MAVRRLIAVAGILCVSALVTGGCTSADATAGTAATESTIAAQTTTVVTEPARLYPVLVDGGWSIPGSPARLPLWG